MADSKAGRPSLLPDFSYSGYHHGEKAIPTITGPVFKVTDYGAVPDDRRNDSEAIQKAIDACENAGGGVVLFPKGVFTINDTAATEARLRVTHSHVILRGAGSGRDGTILDSPSVMQPEDPKKMWTGRCPLVIGASNGRGNKKAKVTAPAPLGSMTLTLSTGHPFRPGDRLVLRMSRPGEAGASFVAPRKWDPKWTSGIAIREIHEVATVGNNVIRLAEPLMIGVDDKGDWSVEEARFLSEVGVEGLRFRGAWKEKFVHHRSWRDDSGWRGFEMHGCENSWIRNCVFEDMNWALRVGESRQITVEDIEMVGTPSHFGVQVHSCYGVLGLRIRDLAGQHHGPSLEAGCCSTVYHQCQWGADTSFDSHAHSPYSTLYDCDEGGLSLGGVGGNRSNLPHHLHALVLWNLKVAMSPGKPVLFWSVGKEAYPRTFTQVLLAGVHGAPVQIDESTVCRNESPGQEVEPRSLWLAQLERRLGKVPPHFEEK